MSPHAVPELVAPAPSTPGVGGAGAIWLLIVAASAIAFGVGYRLGLQTNAVHPEPAQTAEDRKLPSNPATPAVAGLVYANDPGARTELSRFPVDPASTLISGETSFEQMAALVRNDADARAQLWARYRAEVDPLRRQSLLALLAETPDSARADFVAQLVADADPERRRDGYSLLTSLPIEDASLREQALRALQQEADPSVLAELVQGLQPGLLAREDAEPLAQAMEALTQASDPRVRAAALPALTQWADRAQLETRYLAALGDSDADVRAAAIAGIDTASVSTPELRGALFQLAANPAESSGHRHSALLALSRFRLSRNEIELYRMLQAEVPVDPGDG
jgi:hypothetical protein